MKKIILFIVLILTIVISFFAIKKNEVNEESCRKVSGKVTEINEDGIKDATFKLSKNDTLYYINRGLENKFSLNELRKEIMNKEVTIYYVENNNFLSSIQSQQIRKLEIGKKTLYSEF